MIKSAMITECWTLQGSHRDTCFSIIISCNHTTYSHELHVHVTVCINSHPPKGLGILNPGLNGPGSTGDTGRLSYPHDTKSDVRSIT